jgi:hypothetical protein
MEEKLIEYLSDLHELTDSFVDEFGDRATAFTKCVTDDIGSMMGLDEIVICHRENKNSVGNYIYEIYGYSISSDKQSVTLFYTIYDTNPNRHIVVAHSDDFMKATARLKGFYQQSLRGLWHDLDENDELYYISKFLCLNIDEIVNIRLCILTNCRMNDYSLKIKQKIYLKQIITDIWDIRKLYINTHSGLDHIPINIDLEEEYKYEIPFIQLESQINDYKCLLCLVPAKCLSKLYEDHTTKLLQNNVRYFLGFKGKQKSNSNVGILETLRKEPDMFLAYNNGITATAVSFDSDYFDIEKRCGRLKNISDFQILNGGQTTASIYFSSKQDKENRIYLNDAYVQMKLIVVPNQKHDVVQKITQYSNSQNKIKFTDFTINNKFNIKLQEHSRTIYASDEKLNRTLWYYERVRGQYDQDLNNSKSKIDKDYFKKINPKNQIFKKELVSRVWTMWYQSPCDTLKGEGHVYDHFMNLIGSEYLPDEKFFEDTVALIIIYTYLFQRPENKRYANLKSPLIAYTISLISSITVGKINLKKIWQKQKLTGPIKLLLDSLMDQLFEKVMLKKVGDESPVAYCKRPTSWEQIKKENFTYNLNSVREDLK